MILFKQRIRLLITVLCFVVLSFAVSAGANTNNLVNIRLSELLATNRIALMVTFTNCTDAPIHMFRSDLPWKSRHSLTLVAMKAGRGNVLIPENLIVDDPVSGEIEVLPNQGFTGTIDLISRFPSLMPNLREADVILFWTYSLTPIDGASFPREGGWLLIPRKYRD